MISIPSFIRQTSRDLLLSYFQCIDLALPGDFDWSAKPAAFVKNLIGAIEKMPEHGRERLNADVERLVQLVDNAGQAALVNVIIGEDAFDRLEFAHDRAVWAFLNRQLEFGRAEQARYADEWRRKKHWDGWVAASNIALHRDKQTLAAFKQEVRTLLGSKNVHVDVFDRVRHTLEGPPVPVVQVAIFHEGLPTDDLVFADQEQLVRRSRRPVDEAAITYEPKSGAVEVVARRTEIRERLLHSMARDLMKIAFNGNRLPFKRYNLAPLMKPCDFPRDAEDRIEAVDVRSLRLMPMDALGERVILETPSKPKRTIWDMAKSHFGPATPLNDGFVCTQAKLVIKLHPRKGATRGRAIPLTITMPHSCNLRDLTSDEQMIGEKYLRRWNLLRDA